MVLRTSYAYESKNHMAKVQSASLFEQRSRLDTCPNTTGMNMSDPMNDPGFSEYRNILMDRKGFILGMIGVAFFLSTVYVIFATPVYRANILLQIEDSAPDSKSFLTDTTGLGEVKTSANGEIQVLGSRMVLGPAVDQVKLYLNARPRYFPLFGEWLARGATKLSAPGFPGLSGYVTGTESIGVDRFLVPPSFEDAKAFTVTARGGGRYTVEHELLPTPLEGMVGVPLQHRAEDGTFEILVRDLSGEPGAEFSVDIASRLRTIERLQERLLMTEQGRQSNVVNVALEDSDRVRLRDLLNAIADAYVRQNVERKSAEAEKTLAFLNAQLPLFELQLRASEDAFARFRNEHGTIAFDEEAKVWLKSAADLQTNLLELQQSRLDLIRIANDSHPKVQTLDQQILAVRNQLAILNRKIAATPNVQRDALRLERDMRANSAQYQSMQNNALQMRLLSEGKIGNVRLLDRAVVAGMPVKPQKLLSIAFALVVSALLGPLIAIFVARTKRSIQNVDEVIFHTGIDVFGAIPLDADQARLSERRRKNRSFELLVESESESSAAKALQGMRIGLRLVLGKASNNRILFAGASAGAGTSFVAANFAALVARSGKRTLLIETDLRKNGRKDEFGLPETAGLRELSAEILPLERVIQANVRPNLDVLAAGRYFRAGTDLFEGVFFARLLDDLSNKYDHLVLDGPPLTTASDALAIAPECGCILIVAKAGSTVLRDLDENMRLLVQVGTTVDGFVVNAVRSA